MTSRLSPELLLALAEAFLDTATERLLVAQAYAAASRHAARAREYSREAARRHLDVRARAPHPGPAPA
jgi:hypothetical protein